MQNENKIINFKLIRPQDGEIELVFKQQLLPIFLEKTEIKKAYLILIQYENKNGYKVALFLKSNKENINIIQSISNIYEPIFKKNQALDILFLDDEQEKKISQFCAPFFNRNLKINMIPNFYLSSSEGYGLDSPRKCYCVKQLSYEKRYDLILVNVAPPIIYQNAKKEEIILDLVILAGRYIGYPIFPLKNWPIHVYIIRLNKNIYDDLLKIDKSWIENIAWGELYSTNETAKIKKFI